MAAEIEDVRQRLEVISEELADLALDRLRNSIDSGGDKLPLDEKSFAKARRSVEKAISILKAGENAYR